MKPVQVFEDLLPGLKRDEDPDPTNKKEVAVGSLERLKPAIHTRHLLGWVVLMQITEPVTTADCLKDGLVLFVTFSNVN